VRAVVAAAPDPITWDHVAGGPPLLLLHGSADQIVSPSAADAVFGSLSPVRFSVTLLGADHASAIIGPSAWTASFDDAVGLFLHAALGHGQLSGLGASLRTLPGATTASSAAP